MTTQKRSPRRYRDPIQVDATPEQLIRAVVTTPPKKPHEWEFMRKDRRRKSDDRE